MTIRPLRVTRGDGSAGRIARYLLDEESAPQAFVLQEDVAASGRPVEPLANSMWVGSEGTLGKLGLERGAEVNTGDLIAALEGRNVLTGEQKRRGKGGVVANVELGFHAPKSVSVVWSQAGLEQRAQIERAMLVAANRALEYLTQTKKVVRERGPDGKRVSEVARGMAASLSLHAAARPTQVDGIPAPQLHVHCALLGVEGSSGRLVSPDSWPLFRLDAPLEGGAVFRAVLADELVRLGYEIESDTGKKGRFFEIAGVAEGLREAMSGRTREVLTRREQIEQARGVSMRGAAVAVLALETRLAKLSAESAEETVRWWRTLCEEFGFTREMAAALRGAQGIKKGYTSSLRVRRREALEAIEASMREQGPTVSLGAARGIAYAAAAGRMTLEQMHDLVDELERSGEWVAVRGRRAPRATTRGIRRLEQRVLSVALAAARRSDPPLSEQARARGIEVANARLDGGALAKDQLEAVERLTSGRGWVALTGRAGTGKDPTLHAVAAAYWAEGWEVIACAQDGTNAKRLGDRIGAESRTIEQVKEQMRLGRLSVDDRTLILIDEATKVGAQEWGLIATLVQERGVRVVAVGHTGQLDAIELPGLFAEMVRHHKVIPVAVLRTIRRHLDPQDRTRMHPWLRDYQIAVDQGAGPKAVGILRSEGAINLYDTRQEAMEGMVAEWDVWRENYELEDAVLIVHGSNPDVDEVNVLAQACRHRAGQLGEASVEAVDRSYRIHAGDLVILRGGAYRFKRLHPGPRARRVENGQIGMVDSVDPERQLVRVLLSERDQEPRLVEFDVARMRRDYTEELARLAKAGKRRPPRAPVLRLRYGTHPNPEMGSTVDGSAALLNFVLGKEAAYVADTRARFRHSVHVARADLLALIEDDQLRKRATDEDLFKVLARQIATSQKRAAAISHALNPGARINVDFEPATPLPETPLRGAARAPQQPTRERDSDAPPTYRSTVQVDDPLRPLREVLGEARTERIAVLARARLDEVAGWDEQRRLTERDAAAEALASLDNGAARETFTIELEQRRVEERSQQALEQAGELERRAAKLTRLRQRGEREELLQAAQVQRELVERDHSELAQLGQRVRDLRAEGRHPDQWIEQHGEQAALWVAVEQELAIGRALKTLDHVDLDQLADQPRDHPGLEPGEGPDLDR